jgi:ABC-2 type transport system permease protein
MTALVHAELLKLRTTRTFVAFVVTALALSLLVVVLTALLTSDPVRQDARDLLAVDATSLFVLLLGTIGMTGEWRHRTIASSFLAAPDRRGFLAAKLAAYAVAGVLLSLIVTAGITIASTIIFAARGAPTATVGDMADALWRNLLVAALFGAMGVAIGALVRNQIAAVVGLLVAFFIVEPTLIAVAPDVERFGPMLGAPSAIAGDVGSSPDLELLSAAAGTLVLVGWIALFVIPAAVLLERRDLT